MTVRDLKACEASLAMGDSSNVEKFKLKSPSSMGNHKFGAEEFVSSLINTTPLEEATFVEEVGDALGQASVGPNFFNGAKNPSAGKIITVIQSK